MERVTCKLDNQGRVTLPVDWRRKQGLESGDELVVLFDASMVIIETREQALHDAQSIVARNFSGNREPAVRQLLRSRRQEAREEFKKPAGRAKGIR